MNDALIGAVREAWREAARVSPGTRAWRAVRAPCPGPLAVLAAIREADGAIALLFECPIENAPAERARFEADGISMLEDRDYRGRTYRVAVTLERRDLENIFGIVTADLIEAASAQAAAELAVAALFSRLATWQAFLRARRTGLGREAMIGLIGELIVLRRIAETCGWSPAVDAWKGPTGGLHDFVRRGHAIEVKTGTGVVAAIEISSLDQLEDAGLSMLLLGHVHLAESAGGQSLPQLASAVADDLDRSAPGAMRLFRDSLLASGYADVDADLYVGRTFQTVGLRFYRVSAGFPRLTRPVVPAGITEVFYRVDLRAIQMHVADEGTAAAVMREMGNPS